MHLEYPKDGAKGSSGIEISIIWDIIGKMASEINRNTGPQEENKWKSHRRRRQIEEIYNAVFDARRRISIEHKRGVRSLRELTRIHPVLMALIPENRRRELIDRALEGAGVIHATNIIRQVFGLLKRATRPDAPKRTNISLSDEFYLPKAIEAAFKGKEEILQEVLTKSQTSAINTILEALQMNRVPLLRYKRGLLATAGGLQPTKNGGSVIYLPTKINRVCVRYLYPPGQETPFLSLRVTGVDNTTQT